MERPFLSQQRVGTNRRRELWAFATDPGKPAGDLGRRHSLPFDILQLETADHLQGVETSGELHGSASISTEGPALRRGAAGLAADGQEQRIERDQTVSGQVDFHPTGVGCIPAECARAPDYRPFPDRIGGIQTDRTSPVVEADRCVGAIQGPLPDPAP